MLRARLAVVVLAMVFLLGSLPAFAEVIVDEALFKKIEANLMCTDGCGMYLKACDNNTARQMRVEIRQKLSEGMTEQEIYGYMMEIYGEEVMAAPPPSKPFNITAWVTPFLAVLGGGVVIYMALDRWVFNAQSKVDHEDSVSQAEIAEYEEKLEEEVRKYY